MKLLALILFPIVMWSQECSPYHTIPSYKLSDNKSAAIGYVSCIHARGVIAEVGYNNIFTGILAMGQGHHGATYTFLQYEFAIRESRIYLGPAYRLNHNPALLIGRAGIDYKLYNRFYATAALLQVNRNLNYLHVGIKLVI